MYIQVTEYYINQATTYSCATVIDDKLFKSLVTFFLWSYTTFQKNVVIHNWTIKQ